MFKASCFVLVGEKRITINNTQ